MMPGSADQDTFAKLFGVGTEALVRNAFRLGLTWRLRLGTVMTTSLSGQIAVRLDGDDTSIAVTPMTGPSPVGARVYVISIPPAGNYLVGTVLGSQPLQLVDAEVVDSTSAIVLTTVAQLVPGCTYTASTIGAFEYEVTGIFDFRETAAGTTVAIGELFINGVVVGTKNALFGMALATDRSTVSQQWHGTGNDGDLFELYVRKSVNVGTVSASSPHTTLGIRIWQ